MRSGWCFLIALMLPSAATAQLPVRKYLPIGLATEAVLGAVEKCEDMNQFVAAAVVDSAGQALAILRHDRAKIQSLEQARAWAQQGAMRVMTAPPAMAVPPRPPAAPDTHIDDARRKAQDDARRVLEDQRRRSDLTQRRMMGLPIEVQDRLVAQIAVSGAYEPENDLVCAKAGIDRIRSQLR
jgi:uncharacterized protein GlcG (DUF336 family)